MLKKLFYFLVFLMTLFLIGCNEQAELTFTKTGRTEYYVGESFDCQGFFFKTKENKEIELTLEMIDNKTFSQEGEDVIKVSYDDNGKTFTGKIKVFVKGVEEIKLESIEITNTGKNVYYVGEYFDASGYEVECTYTDSSKRTISLTNEMIKSNTHFIKAGTEEVKIAYEEKDIVKETVINVTIKENELVSIEVIVKGKDYYSEEVELDLSDYIFELKYASGETEEIKLTNEYADVTTFLENYNDEPIKQTITIKYKNVSTAFDVDVYSPWDYETYVGTMEANEMVAKIYEDINAIIPQETETDIVLPDKYTYGYAYTLIFSSSDYDVLKGSGRIERYEEDKVVTLTLKIKNDYVPMTYSWDIVVKGLGPVVLKSWNENDKHIFAYFYEGTSSKMTEEDAQNIDVINYCFAGISNGEINLNGLNYLTDNLKLRRSCGVRIVLSVGGGGTGSVGFSGACLTSESRAKFIKSIMDVIEKYQFDGIDLDWEYPSWTGLADSKPEDRDNFTLLCKELREAMDNYKEGLLLTSAVIGGLNVERFYDLKELNKYLDYFHLMTYDLNNSGITSHHTNSMTGNRAYSVERTIKTYSDGGIDVKKLVIGAAFYGKISRLEMATTPENALGKAVAKTNTDSYETRTITYTDIYNKYLTDSTYKKIYDEATKAYYLSNGEYFITYDCEESIITKCQMVEDYKLGGIMFWDYGSDKTGTLLQTMVQEINKIN